MIYLVIKLTYKLETGNKIAFSVITIGYAKEAVRKLRHGPWKCLFILNAN